jgi:predicted alpha/beta superfamily hydrolase
MKEIGLFVLLVASAFAITKACASEPVPAHTSFTVQSVVLDEVRRINVYTPPGYDTHKDALYPVLYVPDGGMREDFPHVASDVDSAIRSGTMRPMIVVGIENTQRRRDMTAPTTVASDLKIAPHVGGAAAFRRFIADELMPAVRQRYRTNGRTAIVGESLAGLFVMETFFARPELFDTYIALSPSLWWNHEALAHGAAARLKRWPGLRRTLYIASAGDDVIGNALEILQAALRATSPKGLTWYYQPRPDLHHSDIYRRLSPTVFRTLFPVGARSGS